MCAALGLCVGVLCDRTRGRRIKAVGGVVKIIPRYSLVCMIFVLGALGLPGTTGFLGEFLVLIGIFQKNFLIGLIATIGVVLCAAYMLWLSKRVIFGQIKNMELKFLKDVNISEGTMLFVLAAVVIIFGFFPEPLLNTMNVSVNGIIDNYQNDLLYHLSVNDI